MTNRQHSPRWRTPLSAISRIISTCRARILSIDDDYVTARILIDPGSELSFVTEELVHRIRLNRKSASIPLLGIGGSRSGRTKSVVTAQLYPMQDSSMCCKLHAYILPRLTCQLPAFTAEKSSWSHLEKLQLAEPDYWRPGPIDIIIESDSYGQIIKPEIIQGYPPTPLAQLTIFGWVRPRKNHKSYNSFSKFSLFN